MLSSGSSPPHWNHKGIATLLAPARFCNCGNSVTDPWIALIFSDERLYCDIHTTVAMSQSWKLALVTQEYLFEEAMVLCPVLLSSRCSHLPIETQDSGACENMPR